MISLHGVERIVSSWDYLFGLYDFEIKGQEVTGVLGPLAFAFVTAVRVIMVV